jgi:hypothetical protein
MVLASALLIAVSCLAQQSGRTGSSGYTGFGASGFAAPPGAGRVNGWYGSGYGGYHSGYGAGRSSNGYARQGALVAPIYVAVPVYGGYGYGPDYADPTQDQTSPPQSTPSVIVNQNYVPDHANPMVREVPQSAGQDDVESYQAPGPPPAEPSPSETNADSDQPTMYLIAFHDHTIVPALAYWTEGNMLKYVNIDHGINQASLDLVDRDLSRLLNEQRNVDFRLPAAR